VGEFLQMGGRFLSFFDKKACCFDTGGRNMSVKHLGFAKNIADMRAKMSLSQEELATKANISRSMLSKIERGEVNPTILVASKIARVLNTLVSVLLDESMPDQIQLKRKNERIVDHDPMSSIQRQLIMHNLSLGFELQHLILPPATTTGVLPPHKMGSMEYIIIEQGRLQVKLEKDRVYLLDPGDCLSFSGGISHEVVNKSLLDCHMYLVRLEPPGR
jgi:DNA-binding XRE family transcriptional regulator